MFKRSLLIAVAISLAISGVAIADPGDGHSSHDVSVDNWQTWHPKVTALRSLNAYLATDKNEQIYYIPTLEELPDIKNAVSDCKDYKGQEKKFAAVYDGYFDQMCREALVRKSDGTYSNVPAIVQTEGSGSVRELTTLGYDFLLKSESVSNVETGSRDINAKYSVQKIDRENGFVDLNTALMDIYKAIGQSKFDVMYAFSSDDSLTVENSPIQEQINLLLSKSQGIDTSDGKAWVFVTRTNPILYWKQAAYDGVIWDAEVVKNAGKAGGASNTKDEEVSLAQFCEYAYNIMNIYGEPVMTQAEKNILLQLYGSTVPYKSCTSGQVKAIETFIAKGIISPEEDASKLLWNSDIDYEYMLTLLMRIADTNARTTYKDVQITMDASMIENGYYNANLSYETSNVVSFTESKSAARVTNYYDVLLGADQFMTMANSVGTNGVDTDLFIPAHLVFTTEDGNVFPINTQVTAYTQKIYSKDYPKLAYVKSSYDVASDGPLMQFCASEGITEQDGKKMLQLRIAAFTVDDLLNDDGMYHLQLISDKGELSSTVFKIQPGGGVYYTSGNKSSDRVDDDYGEDEVILSNQKEINNLLKIYKNKGQEAAERQLAEYEKNNPQWTTEEIDAAEYAASNGEQLASTGNVVMYMEIVAGTESSIVVQTKEGSKTLADIMGDYKGKKYLDPNDQTSLAFKRINQTHYQVENCTGTTQLNEVIKSSSVKGSSMAYCYQDTDLMVSVEWLKNTKMILKDPVESGDVLMLTTKYSNIWLDKKNKYIVVGSCVYDLKDSKNGTDQVWFKTSGDTFVNFRAVLGWTGAFNIFKCTDNKITVSVMGSGTSNGAIEQSKLLTYATSVKLQDIKSGENATTGNTIPILRLNANDQGYKTNIPMTSQYPFGNYLVYISPKIVYDDNSVEYHDWLFVFKPKNINLDGARVNYDDTESRKQLHDTINMDVSGLDANITVWAYPLYRDGKTGRGMPDGMTYTSRYGYIYHTPKLTDLGGQINAYKYYFDTGSVMGKTDSPKAALPFFVDGAGDVRCFNYNTYVYTDSEGNEIMMDYGKMPASVVISSAGDFKRMQYETNDSGEPTITEKAEDDFSNCKVNPTITSPALWFLELQKYDLNTILANHNKDSVGLYWGVNKVNIVKSGNEYKLTVGANDLTDAINNKGMKFLLMRETGSSGNTVGAWYSVSALSTFKLESIVEGGEGTNNITGPPAGQPNKTVDSIDWDEFKLSRLLETGEFTISIATIFALFIIPRIGLFCFLLLTALSVIQNVKLVQLFCDRVFDPYKFLTAGRRDVHSFQGRRAFVASIIAMAVFALFMDGTIIHIYEWIMQFVGAFLGQ